MMTIVYVCIFVTCCIMLAFWVGKKIGQSRVFNLEKKMNEYEHSFNTMQAGFKQVVDFYINDLEKHTEEIKELLFVADKKCLYAHDLLDSIDDGIDSIKRRNLSGETANIVSEHENEKTKELKREFKTAIDEVYEKLEKINKTINVLKSANQSMSGIKEDEVRNIVNQELGKYLEAMGISEEITEPLPNENIESIKSEPLQSEVSYTSLFSQNNSSKADKEHPDSIVVEPISSANIFPSDKINRTVSKEKTKEIIERIAKKDMSYVRPEVIKMYADGMSIPQIAKEMNIGMGEVQVILNLFGGKSGGLR